MFIRIQSSTADLLSDSQGVNVSSHDSAKNPHKSLSKQTMRSTQFSSGTNDNEELSRSSNMKAKRTQNTGRHSEEFHNAKKEKDKYSRSQHSKANQLAKKQELDKASRPFNPKLRKQPEEEKKQFVRNKPKNYIPKRFDIAFSVGQNKNAMFGPAKVQNGVDEQTNQKIKSTKTLNKKKVYRNTYADQESSLFKSINFKKY